MRGIADLERFADHRAGARRRLVGVDRTGAVGPAPEDARVQSALDRGRARRRDRLQVGEPENADVARGHGKVVERRRGDGEVGFVDTQREVAAGRGEEALRGEIATEPDDGFAFAFGDHDGGLRGALSRR